jgi:hypothetical protein
MINPVASFIDGWCYCFAITPSSSDLSLIIALRSPLERWLYFVAGSRHKEHCHWFNRSIGNLPKQAQQAIDSMNNHLRSQGNNLTPLQKRLNDFDKKNKELYTIIDKLSWSICGGFLVFLLMFGGLSWLTFSNIF